MAENKESNFYIKIPSSILKVLRKKLVEDGKIKNPVPYGKIMVVGAIIGLSKKKGFCYAKNSNEEGNGLAELLSIDVGTLKNYLSSLEKDGIIYRSYVGKERRLRISEKLISQYPEIAVDVYNESTNPSHHMTNSLNQSYDITNQSYDITNQSYDITNQSYDMTNQSHDMTYPYYIYKLKESITKLKENKNKDFWLVNLEDVDFKKWLKDNPLDYKQSQKEAFDAISNLYPVGAKTKEARGAFEKLDAVELKELFESMPMFLDHLQNQKNKNFEANEPEFKYIQKFVNYISQKSFKNYQKKFQEGRVFGAEEFEAFLERVEEYAYEMSEDGFFINAPVDAMLDYMKLKTIVWNRKNGKSIDELRPFCRALTGFKEEMTA